MAEGDAKPVVTFLMTESSFYRRVVVNGVFGGVGGGRNILANFFFETPPTPVTVTHEITDDGVGNEVSRTLAINTPQPCIERRAEVGVVLDTQSARAIAVWLQQKADELDSLQAAVGAQDAEEERDVDGMQSDT